MMDMLQKSFFDGIRLFCTTSFWTADIIQDQLHKTWTMLLEQNGKMQDEMESILSSWMLDAKRGRDEVKLNLEKGMKALEENLLDSSSGPWPLAGVYANWPEMQMETMRNFMGFCGFPPESSGGKGEKEKVEGQAAKAK